MLFQVIRAAAAGLLPLVFAAAHAHDAGERDAMPFLDCENPPAHAMLTLPEPIARWTAIQCTPAGQMLIQSADWIWRYPGSFTDRPFLPARMTADPSISPEPRYFQTLEVRELPAAQLPAFRARIAQSAIDLPAATDATQPERLYHVVGKTNHDEAMEVNFLYRSDSDIWAIPCAPECRPEQVFHIYRREE
jgi:hypothetical protein